MNPLRPRTLVMLSSIGIVMAAAGFYVFAGPEDYISRVRACGDPRGANACLRDAAHDALETTAAATLLDRLVTEEKILCHLPGHAVGYALYEKKGLEAAIAECTVACNGACVHGAVGAALAAGLGGAGDDLEHPDEALLDTYASDICSHGGDGCHGVGHALFRLYGNFDDALRACTRYAPTRGSALTCERGVFMEFHLTQSQSAPISRTETKYNDPPDIRFPCNVVGDVYAPGCYHFISAAGEAVFHLIGITDPAEQEKARFDACDLVPSPKARFACIEGAGFALRDTTACDRYDADDLKMCVYGVVKGLVAYDYYPPSLQFCAAQSDEYAKDACYQSLFSALYFRQLSAFDTVCAMTDDPACERYRTVFLEDPMKNVYYDLTGAHDPINLAE